MKVKIKQAEPGNNESAEYLALLKKTLHESGDADDAQLDFFGTNTGAYIIKVSMTFRGQPPVFVVMLGHAFRKYTRSELRATQRKFFKHDPLMSVAHMGRPDGSCYALVKAGAIDMTGNSKAWLN